MLIPLIRSRRALASPYIDRPKCEAYYACDLCWFERVPGSLDSDIVGLRMIEPAL